MSERRMIDDLLLVSDAVDRAAHLRGDATFHRTALADPSSTVVFVRGGELAHHEGSLVHLPVAGLSADAEVTFLGIDRDGRAHFMSRDDQGVAAEWLGLRELGLGLDELDAALAVTAVALDHWRARTMRCPQCGEALRAHDAGWSLRCERDETQVFPRTDPAAIVAVIGADDRIALGRHEGWPEGRFSTFAGFVEAGESAEAAALREVFEESGLRLDRARLTYLGSQPWPFPQSLMLGYHAYTDDTEFVLDEQEIVDARWFTRAELDQALASGEVTLPPPLSISRRLIERWRQPDR